MNHRLDYQYHDLENLPLIFTGVSGFESSSINKIQNKQEQPSRDRIKYQPVSIDSFMMQKSSEYKSDQAYNGNNSTNVQVLLPETVLRIFSKYLNVNLSRVRINSGKNIDQYLEKNNADAMTLGNNLYFKRGDYDPNDNRTLALLGHELTHVAQQEKSGNSVISGHYHNESVNEVEAQSTEQFIYSHLNTPGQSFHTLPDVNGSHTSTISPAQNTFKSQSIAVDRSQQPMFAEADRNISKSKSMGNSATSTLTEAEMTRVKDEVYRDLVLRMKIDLERGS